MLKSSKYIYIACKIMEDLKNQSKFTPLFEHFSFFLSMLHLEVDVLVDLFSGGFLGNSLVILIADTLGGKLI